MHCVSEDSDSFSIEKHEKEKHPPLVSSLLRSTADGVSGLKSNCQARPSSPPSPRPPSPQRKGMARA